MAFDYTELRDAADEMLDEFGQAAVIRRVTNGGSDTWAPTQTTADTACTVVVVKNSYDQRVSLREGVEVREAVIRRRLELLIKGSLGIVPTPADKLVLGGLVYDIEAMDPLSPGGVTVIYQGIVWF